MVQRRKFSAEFKAKVALEAIRGERSISEIASENKIHPTQIANWKKQLLKRLPEIFTDQSCDAGRDREETEDRLYQEIGRLKVELEYLKKNFGHQR